MTNSLSSPPVVLKLLAHEVRWNLLRHLAHSDYRVAELVHFLALPQNLVSYHLHQLSKVQLVTERKSSADERSIYYTLDLSRLLSLYLDAANLLHSVVGTNLLPLHQNEWHFPTPPLRVLFLCTENSARSQMAEALLHHLSHGAVEAYSAGSQPALQVHPLAIQVMEAKGIDMSRAVPKSVALFQGQSFDAIVTVCDRAREICLPLFQKEQQIHWSLSDPALQAETHEEQQQAFEQTAGLLTRRLRFLLTHLEQACLKERSSFA